MSTAPQPLPRHALGLPAGSVRSLLAFGVLGYLWVLVLGPRGLANEQASLAFIYLQVLMVLILAHFFTAHGKTIGRNVSRRSPLGLPRGAVRFILLAGYLGMAAYLYINKPQFQVPEMGQLAVLPLVLVSAYFVGYVLNSLFTFLGGGTLAPWAQDVQAWVALVAMGLLGIIVLVRFGINTSLPLESQIDLGSFELVFAGVVGLYFGARS